MCHIHWCADDDSCLHCALLYMYSGFRIDWPICIGRFARVMRMRIGRRAYAEDCNTASYAGLSRCGLVLESCVVQNRS